MSSKNKLNRKSQYFSQEQHNQNIQFYDPDDANLDAYQFNQLNDKQYNDLVQIQKPKSKFKTNSYFQESDKYKGRTLQTSDNNQISQDNQDILKNVQQQGFRQVFNQIKKKRKLNTSLLEEKIKLIQQQDQKLIQNIKTDGLQQSKASISLNNQLKSFQNIQQIRYHFQKQFQQIKKFPYINAPHNLSLNQLNRQLESNVINNLSLLIRIQSQILDKIEYSNNQLKQFQLMNTIKNQIQQQGLTQQVYNQSKVIDIQTIYDKYKLSTKNIDKQIQNNLIKWSNKTALLSQISQSNYSSLIMQTPIGQAKKIFSGMDKVLSKSRMKRKMFKILFRQAQNIKQSHDPQIFDDFDLFNDLSKAYQNQIQKDEDGLLISQTKKYLKQRNNKEVPEKKDVDRKASKNRKLRYNVHPKLLNFMTSQQNPYLIEARDQIIKNIFNSGPKQEAVQYIDL